jgi:hypothetical protein
MNHACFAPARVAEHAVEVKRRLKAAFTENDMTDVSVPCKSLPPPRGDEMSHGIGDAGCRLAAPYRRAPAKG